jgi:predicted GH43/DUF377 family glycosyl hydrolase
MYIQRDAEDSLIRFKNKWFLYYGTADSMVGVAISESGIGKIE